MKNQANTAKETLENVVITDQTQILSITPEKASRIKSLRIENQIIDEETFFDFKKFLSSLGKIDSLYFVKCHKLNLIYLKDYENKKDGKTN